MNFLKLIYQYTLQSKTWDMEMPFDAVKSSKANMTSSYFSRKEDLVLFVNGESINKWLRDSCKSKYKIELVSKPRNPNMGEDDIQRIKYSSQHRNYFQDVFLFKFYDKTDATLFRLTFNVTPV